MKRVFRKWIVLVMLFAFVCLPVMAKAEGFSAKGIVTAPDSVMLLAPMGGQVGNFTWAAGDRVQGGELAFALAPTQVLAANDGVITGLHAIAGDAAQAVQSQYGALCHIERDDVWRVTVSTSGAYNHVDNRDVRIGDVLRAQTTSGSDKINGTATVIAVAGKELQVEMEKGDFELEKLVKFYIGTGKTYESKDYVGSGKIARAQAIPVLGDGIVARVLVSEGERVARGQPLFILDNPNTTYQDNETLPEVRFAEDALIAQVLVSPGQFVVKGQAVMALYPAGVTCATLEVDELDIVGVRLSQTVRVVVDAYGDSERQGTVTEICPIGQTVLDTTKFKVKIAFEKTDDLMIGMHVKGYWE